MAQSKAQIALIISNLLVFIVTVVFNSLSTTKSKIFPKATGEISGENSTQITPAGSTFAIWGAIYIWQAVWIIYSLTLICRPRAANILSPYFYGLYTLSSLFNLTWLLVWARGYLGIAFAIIAMLALSLDGALFFAYRGLNNYLAKFPNDESLPNKIDVWCTRFLVINGVVFYATWVTIATLLNMTITLQYDFNANGSTVASVALTILLCIVLAWFILENVVLEKYLRFTFSEYLTLIIALSGILKKQWTDGHGNQAFVLAILIIASLLLLARIGFIFYKEKKNIHKGENMKLILRS